MLDVETGRALPQIRSTPFLENTLDLLVQKVVAWRGEEHLRDDVSILAIEVE